MVDTSVGREFAKAAFVEQVRPTVRDGWPVATHAWAISR